MILETLPNLGTVARLGGDDDALRESAVLERIGQTLVDLGRKLGIRSALSICRYDRHEQP